MFLRFRDLELKCPPAVMLLAFRFLALPQTDTDRRLIMLIIIATMITEPQIIQTYD